MSGENAFLRLEVFAAALCIAPLARAQLRIVTYNIAADVNGVTTPNPGTDTVLVGIGNELVNGIAKPIDILLLQETTSNVQTVAPLVSTLNSIYGPGVYAMGTLQGLVINNNPTSGNGPNAVIYNTNTVQLVSSYGFGTLSSSAQSRQEMRYEFVPLGYDSSANFFLYNGHYKALGGTINSARRDVEAQNTRIDSATLGDGARVLYGGDFNFILGTNEPAWTTLTAPGTGAAIDPHNGSSARQHQTWATDGISIRFDYLFNTAPTTDGHGFSYIDGSLHSFGNDGSIPSNGAATHSSNTALSGLPNRTATLAALVSASDHYPVVADYRLPAKMAVSVGTVSSRVIVGNPISVPVTVSNAAPVTYAIGADTLDYSLSASGDLSGSGSVSGVAALSSGNIHALTLDASSVGVKTGTITANSTSQEVAGAMFSQVVSTTVVEHSTPSFDSASATPLRLLDFGIRARGLAVPSLPFDLFNLADPGGFTAALQVDQVLGAGPVDTLSTDLSAAMIDPGGFGASYLASLDTSANGAFEAIYTIKTSDEDIPGAIARQDLTLILRAMVQTGGDSNFDGLVDASDLGTLATHWQMTGGWTDGDYTGDGFVDVSDLYLLASNWTANAPGGPGAASMSAQLAALGLPGVVVPEPTSLGCIGLLVAGCALRRRSRPKPCFRTNRDIETSAHFPDSLGIKR